MESLEQMENATMAKRETAHALLSASGSHRWIECTPSARAEQRYADEGSDYAREGSLAHAMAAKKLKERLGQPTFAETAEIKELSEYMTGEMDELTTEYADFVTGRYDSAVIHTREGAVRPQIFVEKRLDYSKWVRDGFGTGDAVIVRDGAVEIIDLKYGKGVPVDAERNTQMMLYALGAIDFFDYGYPIEKVLTTIYQPRIGNISSWVCGTQELMQWAEDVLRPAAVMAWHGNGARKSGEWCRFCKAKGDCPRLSADCAVEYFMNPNSETLTPGELARLLGMMGSIKDWVKAIDERSLELALGGTEIPGYKIVEGKSNRKIMDPEAVAGALRGIGATDREIYRPRELRTLTDLEKIFGKKEFKRVCGEWIEKPAGKPTLAAVSDKREEINNNDFKDLEI